MSDKKGASGAQTPSAPTPPASERSSGRSRKAKFDVKQVLGIGRGRRKSASSRRTSTESVSDTSKNSPGASSNRRSGRNSKPGTPVKSNNSGGSKATKQEEIPALPEPSPKSVEAVHLVKGPRERKRKKFFDEETTISAKTSTEISAKAENSSAVKPAKTSTATEKAVPKKKAAEKETPKSTVKEAPTKDDAKKSNNKKDVKQKAEPKPKETKVNKKAENAEKAEKSEKQKPSEVKASSAEKTNKETPSKIKQHQDKVLHYLKFDLSKDPKDLAEEMIEGVNIPGPGLAIPVESSHLPEGWEKRVVQRNLGVTKGKWEVYIASPMGKTFRSKLELQRYFDEKEMKLNSEHFDFTLGPALKKLRQIWKQNLPLVRQRSTEFNPAVAATTAAAAAKESSRKEAAEKAEQGAKTPVPPGAASAKSSKDSESLIKAPTKAEVTPKKVESSSSPSPAASTATTPVPPPSNQTAVLAGSSSAEPATSATHVVAVDGSQLGVESETGQGVRCSVNKCRKLFRNEKLLQMHVKHYHPDVFETLESPTVSVAELASSRTDKEGGGSNSAASSPPPPPTTTATEKQAEKDKSSAASSPALASGPSSKKRKLSSGNTVDTPGTGREAKKSRMLSESSEAMDTPKTSEKASRLSSLSLTRKQLAQLEASEEHKSQLGSRSRNDSMLSVASSVGSTEVFLEDTTRPSTPLATPNIPPTPPKFRMSKRRQARLGSNNSNTSSPKIPKTASSLNLGSAIVKVNKIDETADGQNYIREFIDFCKDQRDRTAESPGHGLEQQQRTSQDLLHQQSYSYPPSEVGGTAAGGQQGSAAQSEHEHLTNEEVVNCLCKRVEEDGLMIQCDICLCWQHGTCVGLVGSPEDSDDDGGDPQVPDKHVCSICRDPPGGRTGGARYLYDQDWLKEGKFNGIRPALKTRDESEDGKKKRKKDGDEEQTEYEKTTDLVTSEESGGVAFRQLSDLMADLANMNKVLHSLRVKLNVAAQRNNPKVFMWSSPWERRVEEQPPPQNQVPSSQEMEKIMNSLSAVLDAAPNNRLAAAVASAEAAQQQAVSQPNEQHRPENEAQNPPPQQQLVPSVLNYEEKTDKEGSEKVGQNTDKESKVNGESNGKFEGDKSEKKSPENEREELNDKQDDKKEKTDEASNTNNAGPSSATMPDAPDLMDETAVGSAEDVLENVFDGMMPTVSEVRQLLPMLIEDSLKSGFDEFAGAFEQPVTSGHPPPPPPPVILPPPIIPEQKRIDRDDCRLNLLEHIDAVQRQVERVMDGIEEKLDQLEDQDMKQIRNLSQQQLQVNGSTMAAPGLVSGIVNQAAASSKSLYAKTKLLASILTRDLHSTRKLLSSL